MRSKYERKHGKFACISMGELFSSVPPAEHYVELFLYQSHISTVIAKNIHSRAKNSLTVELVLS